MAEVFYICGIFRGHHPAVKRKFRISTVATLAVVFFAVTSALTQFISNSAVNDIFRPITIIAAVTNGWSATLLWLAYLYSCIDMDTNCIFPLNLT